MDSFRPQRSPVSDRFLSPFSPPNTSDAAGDELDEAEVFRAGSESPDSHYHRRHHPSSMNHPIANKIPNPIPLSRMPERNFGVLAALPEEERKLSLLQRKPSICSSSSTSPSPSSSRMIPTIPKPKLDFSLSIAGGKIYHQSAPVNVPVAPPKLRRAGGNLDKGGEGSGGKGYGDEEEEEEEEEEEMLPPHEIVARASERGSPWTTFSVLEGAGRTLKGRDLRRVRNAVWRQTGFLD